jgi:hypothetical protein
LRSSLSDTFSVFWNFFCSFSFDVLSEKMSGFVFELFEEETKKNANKIALWSDGVSCVWSWWWWGSSSDGGDGGVQNAD